jgi:hypothetical protein
MEDFIALLLFVMFLGAAFTGGFYMGYRYRDNLSLERQKKYRPSRTGVVSNAPMPSTAGGNRGTTQ